MRSYAWALLVLISILHPIIAQPSQQTCFHLTSVLPPSFKRALLSFLPTRYLKRALDCCHADIPQGHSFLRKEEGPF